MTKQSTSSVDKSVDPFSFDAPSLPVDVVVVPFWRAKLNLRRDRLLERDIPAEHECRLDALGSEVLDSKPLTVPMFLEALGQRIERLTRLGQARIDAYDFDGDDDFDTDFEDNDDFITEHEAAGGDFDHIVKKPKKKPADAGKLVSATTVAGEGSEPLPTSGETPPETPKGA